MQDAVVARYLRQTRPALDLDVSDDAAFGGMFADIVTRLRIDDEVRPQLFVAHSAEPIVETLAIGETSFVVFDECLARAFARLTEVMRTAASADDVMKWALRQLAVSLVGLDRATEAGAAVLLAERWPARGTRAADRPPEQDAFSRATDVAVQVYFVLAHECVHVALSCGLLKELDTSEFDEVVDFALGVGEELKADTDIRARVAKEIADDEHHAIATGSVSFSVEREQLSEDPAERYAGLSMRDVFEARAHLREELFCDYIASVLTMQFFEAGEIGPEITLPLILLAMSNLVTIEALRGHARTMAGSPRDAQVLEGVARKSIWRPIMLMGWGERAGGVETLNERFADVVNAHSRFVGDHVLYTLPAELDRYLRRSPPRSVPSGPKLRELLLEVADQRAGLAGRAGRIAVLELALHGQLGTNPWAD